MAFVAIAAATRVVVQRVELRDTGNGCQGPDKPRLIDGGCTDHLMSGASSAERHVN